MIKDGKYIYLDFEKHKDKFIDIFTQYYGEENADAINKRFETLTYVPYTSYEYLNDYYSKKMNNYKEEIYEEFSKLTGIKKLTYKMKEMVWNGEQSGIFLATFDGKNLENNKFLFENRDKILEYRQEVANIFGIKDKDPYNKIVEISRMVEKALQNVQNRHPNDVFADMDRSIINRNSAMQMFLGYVNKNAISLSDKDLAYVSKQDFDSFDKENLDCKYLLFGNSLEEYGLAYYFTSEAEQMAQRSVEDNIRVLKGKLRAFAINLGLDHLQFVTADEVFNRVEVEDKNDLLDRLNKDYKRLCLEEPAINFKKETADLIENSRKGYVYGMYTGCKFSENLNSSYNSFTHSVDNEFQFLTHLDFEGRRPESPASIVFFNEAQFDYMTPKRLLCNLIHELNHGVGHGKAVMDNNKKYALSTTGLAGFLRDVEVDHRLGDIVAENEAILQVEENCNERMALEMADMFYEKYGNIFETSDVPYIYDGGWEVAYNYYSFMTEKFWNKYKDDIKQHRIKDDATIYYDFEKRPPFTFSEALTNTIKYKYNKNIRPDVLINRGPISYNILNKLGNLVVEFQHKILETQGLMNLGITPQDMFAEDYSKVKNISPQLAKELEYYRTKADEIYNEMLQEESKILERKQLFDSVKSKGNDIVKKIDIRQKLKKKEKTDPANEKKTIETLPEDDENILGE